MFFNILAEIVKEVLLNPNMQESNGQAQNVQEKMKKYYFSMTNEQQLVCLKGILEYTNNNIGLYIYVLSYLLQLLNDKKIVKLIQDSLLTDDKLSIIENINIDYQLRRYLFTNDIGILKTASSRIKNRIHSRQVNIVMSQLNQKICYTPYKQRQKRIVMLIEPFLGKRHAPTRKMVNIYHYFENLGYEVYVYATNYKNIHISQATGWWNGGISSSIFEESGRFCLNYYGVDIKGCHVMYSEENYIQFIREIREEIKEFNPLFVMTIGDSNILADTCNEFVDVVTMGCTHDAPVTLSPMVAYYFTMSSEEQQEYRQCLNENQKVIEYIHTEELAQEEEEEYTRETLQIEEKDFVIVIVGNRLDDEVTEETIEVLYTILGQEEDCKIVLIGNWTKLQKKLREGAYYTKFRFVEQTQNLKKTISIGDLFLNPPRMGGGTGALYAVQNNIPVLTLGDCDVANMGSGFVCDKLWDMPQIVHRYICDPEFMDMQKEHCQEKIRKIRAIDNLEQTKKFCSEVEKTIKEREEKLLRE